MYAEICMKKYFNTTILNCSICICCENNVHIPGKMLCIVIMSPLDLLLTMGGKQRPKWKWKN